MKGIIVLRKFLFIACLLCFSGCAATVAGLPINQQQTEKLKANAIILAKLSPIQIAYLKAALGNDLQKLPNEAIECLNRMQIMANDPKLTDEELETITGLADRFAYLVSPNILQQIAIILGQLR